MRGLTTALMSGDTAMVTPINVARSWSEELALGITRASEAKAALADVVATPSLVDEAMEAVGSGAAFDDRFDAVLHIAERGNPGLHDGWTKSDAARAILSRAVAHHPGGAGAQELVRAQAIADQVSGDIGNWIATGGRGGSLTVLEASVRGQLEEVQRLGREVLESL